MIAPAQPPAIIARAHAARHRMPSSPIQHIVFIIQENRSFDDLFQGYPGANTVSSGLDHKGKAVPLQPVPLEAPYDILHDMTRFLLAYDGGKMDGFNREPAGDHHKSKFPQYGYVPGAETAPYFQLANRYVLNDDTFTSQLDGSFTAHQYLIAAQANDSVGFPSGGVWGCPTGIVTTLLPNHTIGPPQSACFGTLYPSSYPTLASELDAAGLTWRYYAPAPGSSGSLWSAYQAIDYIFNGPEWATNVISPQTQILTDPANGTLANVTWVVPDAADSDHAGTKSNTGPQWVASVVNAIGESPFWDSTAIFVVWDDWGGWYDHVPPPQLDNDGLGIRVPLLCISPFAKTNYVSHVQLETASLLRFAEDTFGLAQLAAADTRAADAGGDCLNYGVKRRPFVKLRTKVAPSAFLRRPPSFAPPDDDG